MHGHGDKPFRCSADGCDRGVPGQGFPRRWNLFDHMKRVHGTAPVLDMDHPVRGPKKRKIDPSEPLSLAKRKIHTSPAVKTVEPVGIKPSMEKQFDEQRRQLIASLQHLDDPSDRETMEKLLLFNELFKNRASASPKTSGTGRSSTVAEDESE